MNSRLGETGAQVTSPISGSIIRWHITLATGGPFFLRVLDPDCCSTYEGEWTSAGKVPMSTATQTFKTDLPIKKGDIVGLDNSNGSDTIGLAPVSGSVLSSITPPVVYSFATAMNHPNEEVGFNAVVEPLPTVTHISPRSGSNRGGTKVTIRGTNFDGDVAVTFGRGGQGASGIKTAKKLKVVSDTKIIVVAPLHRAEVVHVIVFDSGGWSARDTACKFRYKKRA